MKPITPKQIAFIQKLVKEQGLDLNQYLIENGHSKTHFNGIVTGEFPATSKEASDLIYKLLPPEKRKKFVPRTVALPPNVTATVPTDSATTDGKSITLQPSAPPTPFHIVWMPESMAPGCMSWYTTLNIPGGTDYLKATVTQTRDDDQYQEYDIKVVYLTDPTAVEEFVAEDVSIISSDNPNALWTALAWGTKCLTESVGSVPASVTA